MQDRESRREAMEKILEAVKKMMPNWKVSSAKEKMEQWKQYRDEVRQKMQDANRKDRRAPAEMDQEAELHCS